MKNIDANDLSECKLITNFEDAQSNLAWRTVNDTVMGGRSSSEIRFKDNKMIFEGNINTNGGGFSSIRFSMAEGILNQYSTIQLKLKSDARPYKLTFLSDAVYRRRPISFQGEIPLTLKNEVSTVNVSVENLQASLFGRKLKGAKFNKNKVFNMGIILADGTDGPFKIEIDTIKACN